MGQRADYLTSLVKENNSIKEIMDKSDLYEEFVIKFLSENFEVPEVHDFLINYYNNFKIDDTKVLIISDTHLSGVYGSYRLVYQAYEMALKKNIKYVVHAGDIIEGYVNTTITSPPIENQIYEALEYYPNSDQITTYYLLGNHDYFGSGNLDSNLLRKNLDTLKNMICIGVLKSYVNFFNHRLYIYHTEKYGLRIPLLNYDLDLMGHGHFFSYYEEQKVLRLPALCLGPNKSLDATGFIILSLEGEDYIYERYCFTPNYQAYLKEKNKILMKD